jgi:two-component system CheB/CheR fusion protein
LLGFVYSPLRAGDLLRSVRRSEDHHDVDFQVFDGPEPITGSELHDSRTAAGRALEAEYVDTLQFPVAGRAWSMIVNSRGDFQRDSDPESWLLMLLGGLALTSMLYLLTRSESEARREAEETAHSLETSREALRLSEERFRKIFDQAPIGIAQTDLSDRLVLVNRRFCELLAHPPEELLGEDMRRFIHPDDQESSAALRRQVLDEGADAHLQKRYLRRDGSVVRAMTVLSLLRDAHGNPAHILAIVEDIGERLRVAEELFAAKEAAETANRAKDHFLAVLSHELRTPLTPVIAAVETFAHEDLPEDTRKLLSIIRRNISLEARLIDDLLDLTRIVNGKLTLHNEPVDAHRVIDDAIDMVEELRSSGVRVVRRYEAAQPTLIGDAARLQQVIWNLIRNAAKFTPFDGRIEISTRNVDSRLEITVTDNGIGIEPDVIPRIFNAFEQGEEGRARRHGGLGLGLTISRMLVEAHGGHISARSEGSGKGATFAVELPGAFDEAVPTPSTFRHGLRASGNGARLLLVDDHEDTRHVLELLLRQLGYEVITASSVRDALEKARGNGFDVIVSDIGLPDGDGYTLIRELRRDLSTPAIALSGYGMDEDVRRSREAGFDDHLTKPVDIRRLNDVILNLLDKDENGQN